MFKYYLRRKYKMTIIYFVRHAQPNFNNHDDLTRELTMQGWQDSKLVTKIGRAHV